MKEIISQMQSFLESYGFKAFVIVSLTVFIVSIIKIPIINRAKIYSKKSGKDKSVITKYVAILPIIISFLLSLILELFVKKFQFNLINFQELITQTLVYSSMAISAYEVIKKQFEGSKIINKEPLEKLPEESKNESTKKEL